MTRPTELQRLKSELANEAFIKEYLKINLETIQSKEEISDDFLKMMFARWVSNDPKFLPVKMAYKDVLKASGWDALPDHTHVVVINPTNLTAVMEVIGDRVYSVNMGGKTMKIILSKQVKYVMWDKWNEKGQIVPLLFAYGNKNEDIFESTLTILSIAAKELGLQAYSYRKDGTLYIIRAPAPPKKGKYANGYEYVPFGESMGI